MCAEEKQAKYFIVNSFNADIDGAKDRRGNKVMVKDGWVKKRFSDIFFNMVVYFERNLDSGIIELCARDRSVPEFVRIVRILAKKGLTSLNRLRWVNEPEGGYLSCQIDVTTVNKSTFAEKVVDMTQVNLPK